jgi:hypothetical protein
MEKEIYAVLIASGLAWVGWISIMTIQNNSKINGLMSIKDSVTDLKDDIKGVSQRLDIFIKNELDAIKEIANK